MNMNSKDELAQQVVNKMMRDDLFSQWLGISLIEIKEGYSKIRMAVREEMINGFGIVHGGICFSLADSAFAFACNNRNVLSVALDTSINFTKPVHVGDELDSRSKGAAQWKKHRFISYNHHQPAWACSGPV
jgi:acyl-CoA thioesterase